MEMVTHWILTKSLKGKCHHPWLLPAILQRKKRLSDVELFPLISASEHHWGLQKGLLLQNLFQLFAFCRKTSQNNLTNKTNEWTSHMQGMLHDHKYWRKKTTAWERERTQLILSLVLLSVCPPPLQSLFLYLRATYHHCQNPPENPQH